jgi:hypothetical protein
LMEFIGTKNGGGGGGTPEVRGNLADRKSHQRLGTKVC